MYGYQPISRSTPLAASFLRHDDLLSFICIADLSLRSFTMSETAAKKGSKYLNRLRVTENLISSYVNLSEEGRECAESFLALQVYGDGGMDHYTPRRNGRRAESVDEHVMCAGLTMTFHQPWSSWAKMITKANLWEFERREAVREMLGSLLAQKNKSHLKDAELRAATENALEWTRWDEHNRAQSRFRNSPEYMDCVKAIAIASGEERKEAIKRFNALVSNAQI